MEKVIKKETGQHLGEAQKAFLIYVRTKQFMKTRLRGIDEGEAIHIPQDEIEKRFFVYPQYERKKELAELVKSGDLEISEMISPKTGFKLFTYKALRAGAIDLYMLNPSLANYGENTRVMRDHLKRVSLPPDAPSTDYFDTFLMHKEELVNLFFKVDEFSGRVHTPVTNLHRTHRPKILIDGCPTVGLDVTTMQPLLLGKILKQKIGNNVYSSWIDAGQDIYVMLQEAAELESRDEGKKRFFEILFAPPSGKLAEMFGDADWITWINDYKRAFEPANPHNIEKPHSNLAWLLQTTEVRTMRKVWHSLNSAEIPFLSIHDEIIIKMEDRHPAESIFREVLDKEFVFYKLSGKEPIRKVQEPDDDMDLPWDDMSPLDSYAPLQLTNKTSTPSNPNLRDITELESFFAGFELPTHPIKLNSWSTIMDCSKFVQCNLAMVKVYNGTAISSPSYNRLMELKVYLN